MTKEQALKWINEQREKWLCQLRESPSGSTDAIRASAWVQALEHCRLLVISLPEDHETSLPDDNDVPHRWHLLLHENIERQLTRIEQRLTRLEGWRDAG